MAIFKGKTTAPPQRNFGIDYLPEPFIDNASGSVTYVGYANMGVQPNEPGWLILRRTTAGSVTITEYAGSNMRFDKVWDDRTSYRYGR